MVRGTVQANHHMIMGPPMMHATPMQQIPLRTSMSSISSFTAPLSGSAQPLMPPPNFTQQPPQQSQHQQRPIAQHAFAAPPPNHMAPIGSHNMFAMPANGQAADRRPITPRASVPSTAPHPQHQQQQQHSHHQQQQQQQAPVHQHGLSQPPSQEKPVRMPTATIELEGVMSDYAPIVDMNKEGMRRNMQAAQQSHLERTESDLQRRGSSQSAHLLDPGQERLKQMYLEQQRQKLRYALRALTHMSCSRA
jgi:hypothetical protein